MSNKHKYDKLVRDVIIKSCHKPVVPMKKLPSNFNPDSKSDQPIDEM